MNATHAPWPTGTLSTSIGAISLTVTHADHMHVQPAARDSTITVRGVPYRFQLHVYRDGEAWRHRQGSDLHVTRVDGTLFREASEAARRTVAAVIEAAVNDWAAEHPDAFRAAVRANLHNDEAALRRDIATLEAELATKRGELAAIVSERRAHDLRSCRPGSPL